MEHRCFAGRLALDSLGLGERLMSRLVGSAEGDYRWALTLFPTHAYASEIKAADLVIHPPVDGRIDPDAADEILNDQIHPEDRERVAASIARALEGHADHDVEYRLVAPDAKHMDRHLDDVLD